ncbi:prephenate dehydratase [Komagataeibacter oboediens]|uniref:prephenate dehydratase n=1 Tax=Komagataeibacter oboediens TaxID=65958 RepID=A0ABS5SLJ1_9PROT|nr:prephenate dehydratase [Komagataeibacter oboediens]MBL7233550.1 prephenate dehydratase [Komagataeibacter oboediens]MBT0675038.1 prephenate dehydratase [Komagataeibacter oboediens]MBT0678425.1 prephenate dehydratase [Komagataeibacter oboediens]
MSGERIIAFQGRPGAYSDLACRQARPGWTTLPCQTFAQTIAAVHDGQAELAMLACENSLAGRVPDIHALLPEAGLFIVGEHFQRVEHCLLGIAGSTLADARRVHTHPVAMAQVRGIIGELGLDPVVEFDTAGAAEMVRKWGRKEDVAVASSLAAELNGLEILRRNVEDAAHNTTRFYIASRRPDTLPPAGPGFMTTLLFRVNNQPGALYKALGGLATAGVNMTRLESYMLEGSFSATQFLMDVEGHPEAPPLARALDELSFFSEQQEILGVYPASPFRHTP